MLSYYVFKSSFLPNEHTFQKYLYLSHIADFNKDSVKSDSKFIAKKLNLKNRNVQITLAVMIYFISISLHGCG